MKEHLLTKDVDDENIDDEIRKFNEERIAAGDGESQEVKFATRLPNIE